MSNKVNEEKRQELLDVEKRIAQYEINKDKYIFNEKIIIMSRTNLYLARLRQVKLIKEVYKI